MIKITNKIIMIIILVIIFLQFVNSMEPKKKFKENQNEIYNLSELKSDGREKLTKEEKIERINGYTELIANQKLPRFKIKEYPKDGLIKDKETAIKLAEIYCYNEFGAVIYKEKPFIAILINNKVWRISGVLPPGCLGGVFVIEMQKIDGKVLCIVHGK